MTDRTIEEKGKLLEWAENHPEAVMRCISSLWATCGAGGRESWFNFSLAIEETMKKENPS